MASSGLGRFYSGIGGLYENIGIMTKRGAVKSKSLTIQDLVTDKSCCRIILLACLLLSKGHFLQPLFSSPLYAPEVSRDSVPTYAINIKISK